MATRGEGKWCVEQCSGEQGRRCSLQWGTRGMKGDKRRGFKCPSTTVGTGSPGGLAVWSGQSDSARGAYEHGWRMSPCTYPANEIHVLASSCWHTQAAGAACRLPDKPIATATALAAAVTAVAAASTMQGGVLVHKTSRGQYGRSPARPHIRLAPKRVSEEVVNMRRCPTDRPASHFHHALACQACPQVPRQML